MSSEITVAVATLALELDVPIDELAAILAEHIQLDASGCRAVRVDVAKQHVANVHAERNATQVRRDARRALSRTQHRQSIESLRARRAAIDYRDRRLLTGDPSMSAIQVMVGADVERRLDARAQRESRLSRGESFGESYGKGR